MPDRLPATTVPLNATLIARKECTERLLVVQVRPDAGEVAPFEPGQFVQIGLPLEDATSGRRPRLQKRSYSIASAAHARGTIELYLAYVPEGRFTPLVWALRPGERLWMDPEPKGHFTLARVPAETELVLVATGTGLAPYVSMLRTWSGAERWRRAVVLHGVRHPIDLGYREELEARAASDPGVVYVPVVSRPRPEDRWTGTIGRVQVVLEPGRFHATTGGHLDPERCHVFLCGNPDMIHDVRAELEPRGFRPDKAAEPGTLHFEKYW
jgi:ferredoxin--NADP+ reductase